LPTNAAAITVLLDIMSIFRRNDLKSEILKELDRHATVLNKIANSEGVDKEKLQNILDQLAQISKNSMLSPKIGINIMESDLFQSIAQRSSILWNLFFDYLISLWLEQEESIRLKDLQHWSSPFIDIHTAIDLILNFIRNSRAASQEVAVAGFSRFPWIKASLVQLIKVSVDKSLPCFAEISGGNTVALSGLWSRPLMTNARHKALMIFHLL